MPYMISSQSVTDGVSLSVSKSKLVYSSLIFLDLFAKITTISNSFFVRNTQVIQLIRRDQHL